MPPPKKQSSVQLARPAYAGRTTSTSRPVPLRGTPVRGTPVRGTPVQVGSSSKSKAHTFPICMHPIVETTADAEGRMRFYARETAAAGTTAGVPE